MFPLTKKRFIGCFDEGNKILDIGFNPDINFTIEMQNHAYPREKKRVMKVYPQLVKYDNDISYMLSGLLP